MKVNESNEDRLRQLQLAKLEREVTVRKIFYIVVGVGMACFLLLALFAALR